MGTRRCLGSMGLAAALLGGAACGAPAPPPAEAPKKEEAPAKQEAPREIPTEAIESGSECAKAEAQCGGGVCSITIDNKCDKAVTCDVNMLTVCQSQTDIVQAKARRKETFAAGTKDHVSVAADCAQNRVLSTKVQTLTCK